MNKLELAQQYMVSVFSEAIQDIENIELHIKHLPKICFDMAEAMLAENEKRQNKSRPEVLSEPSIPWHEIPSNFKYWAAACQDGKITGGLFFETEPEVGKAGKTSVYFDGTNVIVSDSFGYKGEWWDSVRKRP